MGAPRLAVRARSVALGLCLCVACAADAGDPSKLYAGSGGDVEVAVDSGGGGADAVGFPGEDSGGGGDVGSTGVAPDTSTGSSSGGDDATAPEAGIEAGVSDARVSGDTSGCLANIPSSCPDCMTQNASDMPKCEMYLQCFAANDCNPADACGSNDGVCGVNTIGGGEAPLMAATQTYHCACP
jgi:hypothetical protein